MDAKKAVTAQDWYKKHGLEPDADGWFPNVPECKNLPVDNAKWVENIAHNIQLDVPNAKACHYNPRTMVMVCGGPTAKNYLEEIRAKSLDPDYDVFCSNKTGEWLLQNGIIPQYHMILDSKKAKVKDVALKHPDITYLLALNCDPAVFDELKDNRVMRFFCPSNIGGENLDKQEVEKYITEPMLMICGGTMAGVRAITIAEGLGYRNLEYYGFDACIESKDKHYAYEKKHNEAILTVEAEDGRQFLSTHIFADQVSQVMQWRMMLPWVKIKVHGDSFMSHMLALDAKKHVPKHALRMTSEYLELQRQMHVPENYGISGHKHAKTVHGLASQLVQKYGSVSVLDYGCGQSTLKRALDGFRPIENMDWREYDPSIAGKDLEPEPADLVVCSDVLEHIEPDCLVNVLDHIESLAKKLAFFWIDTEEAIKVLPDGRNAHICLHPPDWWFRKIKARFIVAESSVYERAVAFVGQSVAFTKKEYKEPQNIHDPDRKLMAGSDNATSKFSWGENSKQAEKYKDPRISYEIDGVIKRIIEAPLALDPFPYLYLDGIFSPEFYGILIRNLNVEYKSLYEARKCQGYDERSVHDPKNEFWSQLDETMRDGRLKLAVCAKFGRYDPTFKDETLLIRDASGYNIGPHTDSPKKVATLLFYLPTDDRLKEAGTSIYAPKKNGHKCNGDRHWFAKDFDCIKTMPYVPNSMFAFLKSDISFHGVEPSAGVRDTLLYDIRTS